MNQGNAEEARRVYERSARLLFLLALRDVAPEAEAHFRHSLGGGVYVTLSGAQPDAAMASAIEARMRTIAEANWPITLSRVPKAEAAAEFEAAGRSDVVRLLRYRPFDDLPVYRCDGYAEYFYGAVARSTGAIRQFAVRLYYPGLVLLLPKGSLSGPPDPLVDRPKLMRAYRLAAENAKRCGCENAADLGEIIERGEMRQLIRVSEALQQREIAAIAERIAGSGARIVFVAGPSSSGKTTFANRLGVELIASGKRPVAISLDNYYRNREEIPLGPDGKPDLECIEAIDVPLFGEQLVRLLDGGEAEIPRYSFVTKAREAKGVPMRLGPEDVLIVEGIHGLNPALAPSIPGGYKFLVYVSALTPLALDDHNRIRATDARLLRRMVRDERTRGSDVAETLSMWDAVRAGEEKYIFPFQEQADVMFNTSLIYELPVLKRHAYGLLQRVGPESEHYTRCRRLVKFLNYFLDTDAEGEVPPTSILREFIGGCSFYGE